MASLKGARKKTLGTLKVAAAVAPMVLGVGSIGLFMGGLIAGAVINGNAMDYKNTETYQQVLIEETESLKTQLDNGEIDAGEYSKQIGKIGTENYVKDIIKRDIDGNEKWQKMLKTSDALMYSALGSIAGIIGFSVMTGFWLCADIKDSLMSSARRDFRWKPPVVEKPKEEEIKSGEDISSDEENLGSLDEFLDSFADKK